jgi:hypothetical protein
MARVRLSGRHDLGWENINKTPNIKAEWLIVLLRIRDASASTINQDIGLPRYLKVNARTDLASFHSCSFQFINCC